MKKYWRQFSKWSTKHKDAFNALRVFAFFLPITVGLISFLFGQPDNGSKDTSNVQTHQTVISGIVDALSHRLSIPIYTALFLIPISILVIRFFGNRFRNRTRSENLLIGNWSNNWDGPHSGFESATITNDFRYLRKTLEEMRLERIFVDKKKSIVLFDKIEVVGKKKRIYSNELIILTENELVGVEKEGEKVYQIRYSRIIDSGTIEPTQSTPDLKIYTRVLLDDNPETTFKLKVYIEIENRTTKSIVASSPRFDASALFYVDRGDRKILPNSYSGQFRAVFPTPSKDQVETITIPVNGKFELYVPFKPEIGKFILETALKGKRVGLLVFNFYYVDDMVVQNFKTYI